MSKAMEALDRLADTIGGCTCSMCATNREDASTLRDYITTTEAELENSRDVIEEFGAHVEIGSIGHYSAQDAIEGINNAIGPDKKAARIKELEEALQEAWVRSNSYAKRLVNEGHDDVVWYAANQSALSGARKVES